MQIGIGYKTIKQTFFLILGNYKNNLDIQRQEYYIDYTDDD